MTNEQRWRDEREVRIEAPAEAVWAAWAEPEHVRRWFSDEAHGTLEPGAELVHVFEGHGEHRYRVVEVEAPRRLVLDGAMEAGPFRQEVTITRSGGVTVLVLVHSGFGPVDPDSEIVQGIDSGWTMALTLLKLYVERWYGREKRSLTVFRPAGFEYGSLLRDRYQAADGLGSWLTDGAAPVEPGRQVSLRLRSGHRLTGRVLVRTRHEIALEWDELEGALELKAFGAGPGARMLGVRAISWSADPAVLDAVRLELDEAVARLTAAIGG